MPYHNTIPKKSLDFNEIYISCAIPFLKIFFTEVGKVNLFNERQLRQHVKFSDVSGTNSVPIFRVCWQFGSTKTDD